MWVRYLSIAYKRDLARGLSAFVAAVCVSCLSGCACLVGPSSAAYQPGADRSFAKTSLKHKAAQERSKKRRVAEITAPRPVAVPRHLLKKLYAPKCMVDGVQKPSAESDAAGGEADPNLLKIAQLQLERDCYAKAEKLARKRLRQIQKSVD